MSVQLSKSFFPNIFQLPFSMVEYAFDMRKKLQALWAWFLKDQKRLVIGAAVVVFLIGLGIFFSRKNSSKIIYQTSTVQKGTIVSSVSASGKVLITSVLPIKTQASGVVKAVYVKDGDKVYAGQKIAEITLDSAGLQASAQAYSSYLSAKKGVADANTSYYTLQAAAFSANQKFINDAVARTLSTSDPTYIQEYDAWKAAEANFLQLQNSVSQANAGLTSASINLGLVSGTIAAPFGGEISNISLVEGMVLSGTSTQIAVIKGNANPVISVTLSEVDVPKIKVGQKVTVTLDSLFESSSSAGKTFTGVVATVDRIGTTTSNVTSYLTNIKLDSSSADILPNMAATANIILETKTDVLMIPIGATTTQNGQDYVKTLKDGKEVEVSVELGLFSDTETEVVSGLTEGETVITGTSSSASSSSTQTRSVFSGGFGGGAARIGR